MSFPNTIALSPEQEIATTTTQQLSLGTRGTTDDGRVFRYAQAGSTALTAHKLMISAAQGPASTATDQVFYSAYAANTTYVKLALSTVALPVLAIDYFKDGWLVVNSTDVAYNQAVQVDSNEALVSSTALGQLTGVWLTKPGLRKTVDTATALGKLVANPYKLVVASTDANGPGYPLGVTPVAVAADSFFWLQTWGPCLAHAGEGISASIDKQPGKPLAWSTGSTGGVAGKVTASASGYIPDDTDSGFSRSIGGVGTLITAAPAANFFHLVHLTLAP